MTWWLPVLAGMGLWLFVAICAMSLAVVAGRADERDELAERRERRERREREERAEEILETLACEVEARARVSG